jgi:EAL domain-containing protein (putative c-di-GMP-specific phosphodiesterase class I)/ActR/RegA family two-component response regulator
VSKVSEKRARLLVVDDDEEIRSILVEFLSRFYECVALDSAEAALAALATQSFEVIMSDIALPQMTGIEMVRQIIQQAPDSVIVMISGQLTIEGAIQAMRAGAFDYITKPFELSEVADVTRRAVEHRRRIEKARSETASDTSSLELLAAIENDEFVTYFQPQVEIQTRRVVGVEALLRWQHPQSGLLAPADFIPLAEKTGAIIPLGQAALRAACVQARRWYDLGLHNLRVAVNVSPQQLRQADFPARVAQMLRDVGLPAQYLEAEVTESSFMHDPECSVHTLHKLREMGMRIAIDDFGTGYSSLSYLKRLPIDSVKLDSSFVKEATTDPDDAALVMAIITLAHNLRLKVIAEGIETEEQLQFLRLLRCDEGQGYLFGQPLPADQITTLLLDGERICPREPFPQATPGRSVDDAVRVAASGYCLT